MKKKLIIAIIAVVLVAAVVTPLATLAGRGYFAYKSISEVVTAPALSDDGSFMIMSANIRRMEKATSTSKMDVGDHRWYKRAEYYLANIAFVHPDILGAQEVLPEQYDFLVKHLEGYGSVVTYRDDKGSRSESCPIFYNKNRFEYISDGTYWLSKTPNEMSRSWGATEYRITTYVKLKDKVTGETIAFFNAHPEWKVDQGRTQELQVIADVIQQVEADKTVLLGDLNTYKEEPEGAGIAALAPIEAILADSKDLANTYYGYTFNNYGIINPEDPQAGLDYIYLPKDATVREVGNVDKIYDGVYPSDHFPIYAKVIL